MKPGENENPSNPSTSPTFQEVLSLTRRQLVKGGLGAMAVAMSTAPRSFWRNPPDRPCWVSRACP